MTGVGKSAPNEHFYIYELLCKCSVQSCLFKPDDRHCLLISWQCYRCWKQCVSCYYFEPVYAMHIKR